ncbi:hypothetical protein A8990_11195 [Paenibacillus taihuensis]|uniref:Uncharacterized protein n=1 Tax=Paenibacillus taihuensis TaxID=1156355 RepID=A0A3D9S7T1_9BACL|nr:hypothetical protein [Paenibacillus taihuensis]REE86198.1 hypothetical protein A8990_11195 [Paenibacillus taihuensis]
MVSRSFERDVRQLRYGTAEAMPERKRLQAGPLTAVLEDGGLRYIRYRGQEIVRGIYAAVRDQNWGTIKPVFRHYQVTRRGDSFEVAFVAEHRQGEIEFEWKGSIVGSADGTITYTFDGVAGSSFLRNRIGFCVLHPSSLAGCPVEVETADGSIVAGTFPERISPDQPFLDMTAIRCKIGEELAAELRFTGELFEMEDQRNWTDASFKTYCTPLRIPYPVEIASGQRVHQQIALRLVGDVPQINDDAAGDGAIMAKAVAVADDTAEAVTVELGGDVVGHVPGIGLSVTPGHLHDDAEIEALRQLRLTYLRALLKLENGWEQKLACAANAAIKLGVGLELEVLVSVADEELLRDVRLKALVEAIVGCGAIVDAVFVYEDSCIVSSEALLVKLRRLRDEAGLQFRVGGGTRAYFAELNRAELPLAEMDAAMYTINPQVHAFDTASLAETVSAQGDTVRSARALMPGLPLSIGPITFKPRMNPVASSEEGRRKAEDRANHVDARQWSLFGAGWTLGSIHHLAKAGAERACYYETVGPLGVMREGAASAFPLYHVLTAIGEVSHGAAELLECRVSDSLSCEAASVRGHDGRATLLLANYRNVAVSLRVTTAGSLGFAPSRLRVLDERSLAVRGGSAPADLSADAALRLEERPLPQPAAADGVLELLLQPFAFAVLD